MDKAQYILAAFFLVLGTVNTLSIKAQDWQISLGMYFSHPFLQTLFMFLGEMLALIIYYSMSLKTKVSIGISIESEKPFPLIWGLLPAILDCIHSGLSNLGFLLVTASVYQLMRGGVMIFNAVFQYMIFKRKIKRHQTIGIFLMLIAIGMIGISTYLYKNANSMKSSSTLGFVIMLVSQVFRSLYYLSEEYLFIKFNALSLHRRIHLL